MTEIEELRREIAALRKEIAGLRAGPEVHHHYHGPQPSLLPQQPLHPQYYPTWPTTYVSRPYTGQAMGIGYSAVNALC